MESLEHERLTESVHSRRIAFIPINLALVPRHSKQVGISSSGRMCDEVSEALAFFGR